ncbi:TFIIB-type zinc ribbon-containing protein [Thalassococcus lentus]|uniref:Zf-TFIIB domain-containing protein n=1 Tax=Thalassococcus lentus TaxID=1210524 RepID=A0ABT4XWJ4_9RHOB|nr:zf-TFIIB domain-containing protein [Thalassococcus lentus]MDA7426316.1 zf-TFIIB domain-containing protein [Thalassococcus lentus]
MKCPVDGTPLVIADRSGVEIDYCPTCRGVWLDRGELDKIIERAGSYAEQPQARDPRGRADYDDEDRGRRGKKKGGFLDVLDDIFDF